MTTNPDRRQSPEYRAEIEALQREFDEECRRLMEAEANDKLDILLNADWTFEWYAEREGARMDDGEKLKHLMDEYERQQCEALKSWAPFTASENADNVKAEDFWRRWAQAESIDVPAREPRQPALDHYRDLAAEAEMARACDEWERWANGEGA